VKKLVDVTELLVNEEDSSINPKYYFNPNSDYIEERKEVAIQLLQEGHNVFQVAELCALSVRAVRFLDDPSSISYMPPKKYLQGGETPKPVNNVKKKEKKAEKVVKAAPTPIEKQPAEKVPFMSKGEKREMIREILEMVRVAKESVNEVKTND
jgi:hypothetical protein